MFKRVDGQKVNTKKALINLLYLSVVFCISGNIDLYARLNKNRASARQKLDASLAQKYLSKPASDSFVQWLTKQGPPPATQCGVFKGKTKKKVMIIIIFVT